MHVHDRQNLDLIQQEMDFQLSGEVSDESAQSIGRKLGAEIIISGAINPFGTDYRLRLRAIGVETAAIHGIQTKTILMDRTLSNLTGRPAAEQTIPQSTVRPNTAPPDEVARPSGESTSGLQRNVFALSLGGGLRAGYKSSQILRYTGQDERLLEGSGFFVGGGNFLDLVYAEIQVGMMYEQIKAKTEKPCPGAKVF
jgi:hypothetical protein